MPVVSVIIPTFNRQAALAELLEALLRQTYRDIEAIIVNDAGHPVEGIAALYPELDVRIVNLPVNSYHVRARNAALPLVRGEFIMPIDDDDLILPDHIERMVSEIGDADLVYGDAEIVDYAERDGMRHPKSRMLFAYKHDPVLFRTFNTYIASGSLYRSAIHDEIGPFDPEVRNYWDWDWMLRVLSRYRVKKIPRAGTLYTFAAEGGDNQSANQEKMRTYLAKLCEKHGLGPLPTSNFFLLLEEEALRARRAASEIVWDGKPLRSRYRL